MAAMVLGALPAVAVCPGLLGSLTAECHDEPPEVAVVEGLRAHAGGDWRGCVAALDRALAAEPKLGSADLYTTLGLCHAQLGEGRQAVASHRRALAIEPQNHDAWTNLGDAQRLIGQEAEAIRSYERALAIEPYDVEVRDRLEGLKRVMF